MAVIAGKDGVVKVGTNAVGKVVDFDFEQTIDVIESTVMGDTASSHVAGSGISKTMVNMTCRYDVTDTTGQGALTIGASVTLSLYPAGTASTAKYWTGTATITKRGHTQKMDGETVNIAFSAQVSGAFTLSTVP